MTAARLAGAIASGRAVNHGRRGEGQEKLQLVITPPNNRTHAELSWHQSVLLQDGATHPGTYISPVIGGA